MPTIYEKYFHNPLHFQRMLEFFLHARFRAVRIFIAGKQRDECMFFATDGSLVDARNNKRRFATLTDWFNAAQKTNYDLYFTGLFQQIHITNRINLNEILTTVSPAEIAEFHDTKFRSNLAYNYIFRRLRANFIDCDWEKQQIYSVAWRGHTYNVSTNNTYTTDGGNIRVFLNQFVGNQDVPGLEVCITDGSRRNLTDPVVPAEPVQAKEEILEEVPAQEVPPESLMEEWMRGEMKVWEEKIQSLIHEQSVSNQENQQMRVEIEGLRGQVQALSTQLNNLVVQSNHMMGVLGQMLQPPPVVQPVYPVHQTYPMYPMPPVYQN